jgi:lysophospholipase L1-like esterase
VGSKHSRRPFGLRLVTSLGLVAFGLLLGFVAVEAVLQVGALYVRASGRETAGGWLRSDVRVLCTGDSNTYGYLVESEQAYPKVLEREWNRDAERGPIEVMNVGYPGTNSSQLRKNFPRFLSLFRPDVVTMMVGANDFWMKPEANPGILGWWGWLDSLLYRKLRTYRLAHMVRRAIEQPVLEVSHAQPDVTPEEIEELRGERWRETAVRILKEREAEGELFRDEGFIRYGDETIDVHWGKQEGGVKNWQANLLDNVTVMAQMARASGVTLVLITYASGDKTYGLVNDLQRELAPRIGISLIDIEAVLEPRCPEWRCEELLPDQHPSPVGHELAARIVLQRLKDLLERSRGRDGAGTGE